MSTLTVTSEIRIAAPAGIVREQFADVAHHASTHPHEGVEFVVVSDDAQRCRYRQTSRVGPLRLRQEMTLDRSASGPLVNRIEAGQFTGGEIRFDITPVDSDTSHVRATLSAPLGASRVLRPILRRSVERALTCALEEDRQDIESGAYRPHRQ